MTDIDPGAVPVAFVAAVAVVGKYASPLLFGITSANSPVGNRDGIN